MTDQLIRQAIDIDDKEQKYIIPRYIFPDISDYYEHWIALYKNTKRPTKQWKKRMDNILTQLKIKSFLTNGNTNINNNTQ